MCDADSDDEEPSKLKNDTKVAPFHDIYAVDPLIAREGGTLGSPTQDAVLNAR